MKLSKRFGQSPSDRRPPRTFGREIESVISVLTKNSVEQEATIVVTDLSLQRASMAGNSISSATPQSRREAIP
jgi:hypothetical protein